MSDEQTLENQPWWAQGGLAGAFATAVGGELGYQSDEGLTASPLFAFQYDQDALASAVYNGNSESGYITSMV